MTIHSQFWSPKRLEDVKLVAIDSLLSCKPQEVPKHDILQGLESEPFRCASFHTAQRYLQSADQYLYMFKSYHTAQEWFTTQVSPYHAPIVLVGHLVYRYHFVCVCTIDALETICFLFAFVRTHPNLGVLWYKAADCRGIGSDCRLAAHPDFIRGTSAWRLVSF